ncbi:MATE family efflux transporter [Tissierella carlieri]|uniref:Multidrug export protein MepA n=1 Tax=Tissierella carlieri TaxID=689904 RepID=A0ABT1SFW1_9FIRM|nr:MATE family efflux transporter [Tissierella carlieri]MCQ4925377.1 MATE family efflux transporter [Tissierella carlieri]
MNSKNKQQGESILSTMKPSKAIMKLAIPATIALLAKAVYNIVDTAYIGMLKDETALAAVGVTLPLLLIFVSIENIFAAGAAVLAGRQLGSNDKEGANTTVSTIVGVSVLIGIVLCVTGIIFMEPLLKLFGASSRVLPMAKDYAFWMFIAAIANIPAQSLNCAARAESSVKITSIAVIIGAVLNIILDPIFMFEKGFGLGVAGASIATTISQFITAIILFWYYLSGRSIVKLKLKSMKPSTKLFKTVMVIGIPTAVVQICLAVSTSLTNMAAATLPESDLIIAAYGVVQRLVLIGHYVILGFMQGYQPVASYSFGAKNEERFHESEKFALKSTILLTILVSVTYIALAKPLIRLFNQNPSVIEYGSKLLISQLAIYPAFGICYLMTIIFQSIGAARYGVFLSALRQGILYIPFILLLPRFFGVWGIYLTQPIADILTLVVCLLSYKTMKRITSNNIKELT